MLIIVTQYLRKTYRVLSKAVILGLLMIICKVSLAQMQQSVLFLNATLHIGNGEVIEKCALGIENGKIKEVFNARVVDPGVLKYDTVIDFEGHHIYPGFIAPNTNLGLIEIGAVRASKDDDEVGLINPNVRSVIAYNAESKIIPTVNSNGVLIAQVTPRGGRISGSSSVVRLDAWNWEDALIRMDDGIHLNWPGVINPGREKADELKKKRTEEIEQLKSFFRQAEGYLKESYHLETNLKYESMRSLLDGESTLYVHADHVTEITECIYFIREFGLNKVVLVGGFDAWRIPEMISDNKISVIYRRVHSLPFRSDEDSELPYLIPSKLKAAGIPFCLDVSGRMGPMQARNLPFYAGTARTYGLKEEEAVRSITLDAATILGIDDSYGSIEKGKSATLFVSVGDALDIMSNKVVLAMIDGKLIDLSENHQVQLYEKYTDKYKKEKQVK